jgi:hypothetical protein
MTPYYGEKTPDFRLQNTVFCANSGTSRCTLFAYVLDTVGKKRGKNAGKPAVFCAKYCMSNICTKLLFLIYCKWVFHVGCLQLSTNKILSPFHVQQNNTD